MADEQRGLWFVTDVESSETVEVVEGGRSSEDIGGRFGSSAVQAVRKSLTQRVEISGEELKRQIGNLLAVVSDVFDQSRAETGIVLDGVELSIEISSERPDQHPRQWRQARGQRRHQTQLQAHPSQTLNEDPGPDKLLGTRGPSGKDGPPWF